MRAFLMFLCLSLPAGAEEFRTPAPVVEITLYNIRAIATRKATLALPAGRHEILLPAGDSRGHRPVITGAVLVSETRRRNGIVDPEAYFDATQRAAHEDLESAHAALRTAQEELDLARAAAAAFEAELAFLDSVGGANLQALDSEATIATATALREQRLRANQGLIATRDAILASEKAMEIALLEQVAAAGRFDRTAPPEIGDTLTVLTLDVPQPGPVTIRHHTWSDTNWTPAYLADLDEASGVVTLQLMAEVASNDLSLTDVRTTLSTLSIRESTRASYLSPDLARVEERRRGLSSGYSSGTIRSQETLAAPAVILESTEATAAPDGVDLTYVLEDRLTLARGHIALLPLGSLEFPAETYTRAVPHQDLTAFLMARLTNSGDAPLLPGDVLVHRNGVLVGGGNISDLIPAGADFELGFGPQRHLILERVLLENATGDRGLLATSETRVQDLRITVQNLGDQPEEVEVYYALPFAEQEDLSLRVATNPRPSERDVDDQRGVSRWDMAVGPGETRGVELRFEFAWPEGSELVWQP